MNRREFSKTLLAAVTSYALSDSLFSTNFFSKPIKQITNYWFAANTDSAFTMDIVMLDLNGKQYDIHNLDIMEKQDLSD
ncbi:MAG TPA: hypothetical protein PKA90_02800 [Ignavibacteria bacterium]|nr:hypothetical protein [Ignavibacteria bacterium]HMR39337.1 hypothetical protein [Ignavibacteria bacterium]